MVGVHRNPAAFNFYRLREVIAFELEAMFDGKIEVDERLSSISRKSRRISSSEYRFRAINPVSKTKPTLAQFYGVKTRNHINGIENFWNQEKRHMRKFNGIPKEHFGLYSKECE